MRVLNPERFSAIEAFINDYRIEKGCSPTFDEISVGTGIPKTTVSRYLTYMRQHEMLDYDGHRSIITRQAKKENSKSVSVPVLGLVSCGIPKLAEENIEEYVKLPVCLFGQGEFFLLRANGDSMIDAGIEDGDFVLVRQQSYADNGQIVVALVGDEATLKRFYPEPENHRVRLHPENSEMEDIYVGNCIIQGVAVRVIKEL